MNRKELLDGAKALVYGDRNAQHGDPRPSLEGIAALWSVYKGVPFEAYDVAAMMILLKISRLRFSPELIDGWMDIAGYAACGAEVLPGFILGPDYLEMYEDDD